MVYLASLKTVHKLIWKAPKFWLCKADITMKPFWFLCLWREDAAWSLRAFPSWTDRSVPESKVFSYLTELLWYMLMLILWNCVLTWSRGRNIMPLFLALFYRSLPLRLLRLSRPTYKAIVLRRHVLSLYKQTLTKEWIETSITSY